MSKIAIIILEYYLGVSASIIEIAKTLSKEGFPVDIFIDEPSFAAAPIDFSETNINLFVIGSTEFSLTTKNDIMASLSSVLAPRLKTLLTPFIYFLFRLFRLNFSVNCFIKRYRSRWGSYIETLETHINKDYVVLLGVEPLGLIAACYAHDRSDATNAHTIYLNLELWQHTKSMKFKQKLVKDCEIACSPNCDFTIIPDENRGKAFSESNGISTSKLRYLPISVSGDPILSKSKYFRDMFSIQDNKMIVLYAGNVCSWAMCKEIVESSEKWPLDFVLVMHDWHVRSEKDFYFKEVKSIANPEKVFFSTQPVPYDRLPEILSSADVGLAFYREIDANFIEVGSSSNKIAQYFRVGLPVIANDLRSIKRIFDEYNCGLCVNNPSKIGDALNTIYRNYDQFRHGAFNSYRKHYNFSVAFQPILSELKKMKEQHERLFS